MWPKSFSAACTTVLAFESDTVAGTPSASSAATSASMSDSATVATLVAAGSATMYSSCSDWVEPGDCCGSTVAVLRCPLLDSSGTVRTSCSATCSNQASEGC